MIKHVNELRNPHVVMSSVIDASFFIQHETTLFKIFFYLLQNIIFCLPRKVSIFEDKRFVYHWHISESSTVRKMN